MYIKYKIYIKKLDQLFTYSAVCFSPFNYIMDIPLSQQIEVEFILLKDCIKVQCIDLLIQ